MSITAEWKEYSTLIAQIKELEKEGAEYKKIKPLRKKFFDIYTKFINSNNEMPSDKAKAIIKKTLIENLYTFEPKKINDWLNEQTFPSRETAVSYYIDKIVDEHLFELNTDGKQGEILDICKDIIINTLIENTERYAAVPDTRENYEIILSGQTSRLQKKVEYHDFSDSPIEVILYDALKPFEDKYNCVIQREYEVYLNSVVLLYKLDIAILLPNGKMIDIETDGLSFHNSYQTMQKDRARDRYLTLNGWAILRYTTREITRNASMCKGEIEQLIQRIMCE